MSKIAFMGAGSTVFAKNVLGDVMCTPALRESHLALYDIDSQRLDDSRMMLETINRNINENRATITAHLGVPSRREALRGADFVVNAIQVGGYEPATVIDFEIPNKYGLRQTIADTLGIGGIMRALRTIPVVLDFAADMEAVCPDAWFLNYVNPMAMVTAGLLRGSRIKAVGLCHSVQGCAQELLRTAGLADEVTRLQWKVAGINHQGWLLEVADGGKDLYPEIKRRVAAAWEEIRRRGGAARVIQELRDSGDPNWRKNTLARVSHDLVRLRLMLELGCYVTESSEHNAEYAPWFIKKARIHPRYRARMKS